MDMTRLQPNRKFWLVLTAVLVLLIAALVIAGLAAEGVTYVNYINYIERGYEHLVRKFTELGADIRRIED